MRPVRPLLALGLLLGSACAVTPAPAPAPAPVSTPAVVAIPRPSAAPSPSEPPPALESAPAASAPPRGEPVRVADSLPDGLVALTMAERDELAARCKPLTDAIAAVATKSRGKSPLDLALEVLASPPALPGVDVPRCSELMLRELEIYRARAIEGEAIMNLKRISFGMAAAFTAGEALCPSAPPVPAAPGEFRDEKYSSKPEDWKAPGWRCLGFDQPMTQRYQYEVLVDAKARTYEAIARRPGAGRRPPSELFLRGRIENGDLQPNSDVLRR